MTWDGDEMGWTGNGGEIFSNILQAHYPVPMQHSDSDTLSLKSLIMSSQNSSRDRVAINLKVGADSDHLDRPKRLWMYRDGTLIMSQTCLTVQKGCSRL
jgi:hypothetical protein